VPSIEERTAKSAVVSWPQALICGLPRMSFEGSILYVLEAAEGFEVNAATAKYAPEHQTDVEFRLICRYCSAPGHSTIKCLEEFSSMIDLSHFRFYLQGR
jgi:hypothetical protein